MGFTSSISGFFDSLDRAQRAQSKFTKLSAMSDARLASLGMQREDIARAVFQDIFDR